MTPWTRSQAAGLLAGLRDHYGCAVRVANGVLLIKPADRLTPWDRLEIKGAKQLLLELLAEEEAAGRAALVEGFA